MARVLVAGANGFIGRHLVRHLVEFNHDVVCLVRNKPKRLRFGDYATGCVIGDVTDLASLRPAIKNCDLVINLAGVTKSLSRRELFAVNEKGAANVADVCAERTSPPILIHVSSLSAAGTQPNWRIADTNPADEPVSIYGKSKLAGEFALRRYAGQVPISILRPTIVFGEGDRDVLPLFQSIHYYGWAFLPPFARQRFSFIHAADLSQAIRLVALKGERLSEGKAAGTYYAADPNALRFDEFAKAIGNCLKRNRTRTLVSPRWLMALLGGLCSIGSQATRKPYVLSYDKAREANAGPWCCDPLGLRLIGFQPDLLMHRLQQTTDWYFQQGWLTRPTNVIEPNARVFDEELAKSANSMGEHASSR